MWFAPFANGRTPSAVLEPVSSDARAALGFATNYNLISRSWTLSSYPDFKLSELCLVTDYPYFYNIY